MTIYTTNFIPYKYDDKWAVLRYLELRCHDIKKSLTYIEMTSGHLIVRCPLSGEYLTIKGTREELQWLDSELTKRKWYKDIK